MRTLENLLEWVRSNGTEINGKWVPARPEPYYGWYGTWMRLKDAWEVFRGRADAVKWPGGQ